MDRATKVIVAVVIVLLLSVGVLAYLVNNISWRLNAIALLRTEVPKLKSSLESVNEHLKDVSSKVESIVSKLASLSSKVSSIAEFRKELQTLRAELDELNKTLASAAKAEEVSRLASQVKELSTLLKVRDEVIKLSSKLAEISKKVSSAATTEELNELRESIATLREELSELMKLVEFPATVVDATGKPVVIASKPERIVCLLPSVTETVFAVGAGGQVVGVDKYSNYPPEVLDEVKEGKIAVIGSGFYPNIEKILSLNPDLIIGVDSVTSHHTLKKILSKEGIPVILLPDRTVDDVITSVVIVGKATGHTGNATLLAIKLREEIGALREAAHNAAIKEGRPKVAIIVWLNPIYVVGNSTWMHDLIYLAGGVNAFSNVSGWASVSPEALIKAAPDVIIITGHYVCKNHEDALNKLRKLLGSAADAVPAIKNGRVYVVMGAYNDALVRPGPRVVNAVELLLAILHPSALGLSPSKVPYDISPQTLKLPPIPK